MRLLLDEHFSPQIARELRKWGHQVVAAAEYAHLRGRTDRVQFATATNERRALVTRGVADYRPLLSEAHRAGGTTYGLVCVSGQFPLNRDGTGRLVRALQALLRELPGDADLMAQGGEVWLRDSD